MQGGRGKDARGVTASRPVAGANLAYLYCLFAVMVSPAKHDLEDNEERRRGVVHRMAEKGREFSSHC